MILVRDLSIVQSIHLKAFEVINFTSLVIVNSITVPVSKLWLTVEIRLLVVVN